MNAYFSYARKTAPFCECQADPSGEYGYFGQECHLRGEKIDKDSIYPIGLWYPQIRLFSVFIRILVLCSVRTRTNHYIMCYVNRYWVSDV